MRPYIICHMMASLDGRIDCDMTDKISGDEYYEALDALGASTEINGRVTAQIHYAQPDKFVPSDPSPIGKPCWNPVVKADGYHVILDTHGVLQYEKGTIYDVPTLVIVSEDTPTEYLRYLESRDISWIAVGKGKIDLLAAMTILHDEFGVLQAVVTGGGNINGAFLEAGLIDEVSMEFAPGIDGRKGMTAAFDGITDPAFGPIRLKLISVKEQEGGTVWLRYRL